MSSRTKTHAKAGRLTKQGFQKPVLRLTETYQLNSKLFHTELLYSRAGVPAFRFLAVFTATPLSVSFCTTTHLTPRTDGTKVLLDQLAWDVGNNGLIAPVVVAVSTVHNTGDASQ
jgi:hypothetical protein